MSSLKVPVNAKDHIRGNENGKISIVEYGDYQCPYCGSAHVKLKKILELFPDIRFVFRQFPLSQVHPFAKMAAETAEFASSKDKFWEMHDYIYENQPQLSGEFFIKAAGHLKLDQEELIFALADGSFIPQVQEQFMGGVHSGVSGTPTLFINGEKYKGPYEVEPLTEFINNLRVLA